VLAAADVAADPLTALLTALAGYGPASIVCALLFYMLWQKDKRLAEEQNARVADAKSATVRLAEEQAARIADSKGFTELALKLQQSGLEQVSKLSSIFDEIRKQQSDARPSTSTYRRPP
jgi:hypothetical protein